MIFRILTTRDFLRKQEPDYVPAAGEIDFGHMRRLKPISSDFGFSRGGPIDRYYIEQFLKKNAGDIKGHALEVKDDSYLNRFGGSQVIKKDILDIDSGNRLATVIADLSQAQNIPDNSYDCIILTQVLQYIYDVRSTIKHLHRILKPGGILLLTVPGVSHFVYKVYSNIWCWCFSKYSVHKLLKEAFIENNIKIETYGNVLVASSFLYGIGANELKKEEYDYTDPDYQVIIAARAVKSA